MHSCAVYVSSGLRSVAEKVAEAASRSTPRVAIVDVFTDTAYARSSVKLVGEPSGLVCAAEAAAVEALACVDLSQQPHPAPRAQAAPTRTRVPPRLSPSQKPTLC
jgi:glutamate formiminotransferase